MDVDTSELRQLAADLGAAGPRVGAKVAKAVRASAERVKKAAATAAPRRTGRMADSIGYDLYGDGRSKGLTAVVGPALHYGRFVEHGTVRMAAAPFMAPAFTDEVPRLVEALADSVEGVLGP